MSIPWMYRLRGNIPTPHGYGRAYMRTPHGLSRHMNNMGRDPDVTAGPSRPSSGSRQTITQHRNYSAADLLLLSKHARHPQQSTNVIQPPRDGNHVRYYVEGENSVNHSNQHKYQSAHVAASTEEKVARSGMPHPRPKAIHWCHSLEWHLRSQSGSAGSSVSDLCTLSHFRTVYAEASCPD